VFILTTNRDPFALFHFIGLSLELFVIDLPVYIQNTLHVHRITFIKNFSAPNLVITFIKTKRLVEISTDIC
jgi:hypothetical protein